MPRPSDTYTHSQFEVIDSANTGETVQCVHCRRWQGASKVLNRKKAHLHSCPEYLSWRAEGNGEDLQPANPYNSLRRITNEPFQFNSPLSSTTLMPIPAHDLEVTKYFDEFFDDAQKCARVRCQSCGYVRARNVTRMAEHLTQCKDFHATTEGGELLASGRLNRVQTGENSAIWSGDRPNPNLLVNRRGPNRPRGGMAAPGGMPRPFLPAKSTPSTPAKAPSLAQHLLVQAGDSLTNSTQHAFLSHAGCGSLTERALVQWLAQLGYVSRTLVSFTGALIGKIRIPEADNLQRNPTFRALDLLCSAVNNMKKELEFLEATKRKYGLEVNFDEPKPPTKGFMDLFVSAAAPGASLLEGMVMLWAVECLLHDSFSYAGTFVNQPTAVPPQNSYSLPSYFMPHGGPDVNKSEKPNNGHITALREAFIENWKSENFRRFVDACKSIVDELAMAQTSGNGRAEMQACERVFKQAVWLWGQMFPEVTGMGEEDELADDHLGGEGGPLNGASVDKPVELDDDDDASPFGGTGLGPVAAANQPS